jgi:ribose-phosphate pyrophosphokinase
MIYVEGADVEYLKFNAGEPHVKVTNISSYTNVEWVFENFEEFMNLAMIVDVLNRNKSSVALTMRYVPFARQDRATTSSQPFSLEVFCNMLKIDELYFHDVHSEVFEKLMKGSKFDILPFKQVECFQETLDDFSQAAETYDCIISPDKGAVNKAIEIAILEDVPLVEATKTRDPATGALSNPQIDFGDLEVGRAIIVDDILDFGGTFVQLARAIKEQKPDVKLDLYVTHGLFGGGIEKYKGLFENIYCYNIMNKEIKSGDLLNLSGLS